MKFLSMKVLSSLAAAAVVGFLIALFTAQHGCTSNCGANCPPATVYIGSIDNVQQYMAFDVYGPACPPASAVLCTGDGSSTSCTHTTVTGQAPSWCDVLVQFEPYVDGRPDQIIHLQFDQPDSTPGTCCAGYPVIGTSVYVVPDHPGGGGVYGLETVGDAAIKDYDAITTLHDASATDAADAGTD